MPTYGYACVCGALQDVVRPISERNNPVICTGCEQEMQRQLDAPLFKFMGRVTPGGGPDRFTADALGIPLKELPTGLRSGADRAKS